MGGLLPSLQLVDVVMWRAVAMMSVLPVGFKLQLAFEIINHIPCKQSFFLYFCLALLLRQSSAKEEVTLMVPVNLLSGGTTTLIPGQFFMKALNTRPRGVGDDSWGSKLNSGGHDDVSVWEYGYGEQKLWTYLFRENMPSIICVFKWKCK